MFDPKLSLVLEADGEYTIHSVTDTPNSCYSAGMIQTGAPDGVVLLPEQWGFQLHLNYRHGVSLQVITPVLQSIPNVDFSSGRNAAVVFVMLDGKIVGRGIVAPHLSPGATRMPNAIRSTHLVAGAKPAAAFGDSRLIIVQPGDAVQFEVTAVGGTNRSSLSDPSCSGWANADDSGAVKRRVMNAPNTPGTTCFVSIGFDFAPAPTSNSASDPKKYTSTVSVLGTMRFSDDVSSIGVRSYMIQVA